MAHILIFGDSITFGAWDTEGGWGQRLKKYFHQKVIESDFKLDYHPFVLGISGDNSTNILERMEREITARCKEQDEVVILMEIGTNDAATEQGGHEISVIPEEFQRNLERIVAIAKKFAAKLIFVGLTPVDESKTIPIPWRTNLSYTNRNVQKYDSIVRKVAKEQNLLYVELFSKLDPKQFDDGLHPDTEGHRIIYEIARDALMDKKYF